MKKLLTSTKALFSCTFVTAITALTFSNPLFALPEASDKLIISLLTENLEFKELLRSKSTRSDAML